MTLRCVDAYILYKHREREINSRRPGSFRQLVPCRFARSSRANDYLVDTLLCPPSSAPLRLRPALAALPRFLPVPPRAGEAPVLTLVLPALTLQAPSLIVTLLDSI